MNTFEQKFIIFFRLDISSWNLAGCCKTSVWTFSDSFRPIPFLDGEQWTPKDEYRQNTPIIWKFAPPRAPYNTFGPNFCFSSWSSLSHQHFVCRNFFSIESGLRCIGVQTIVLRDHKSYLFFACEYIWKKIHNFFSPWNFFLKLGRML